MKRRQDLRTHTQNGFSALEAVIVVVVLAILGLSGWLFWQRSHTKTATPVAQQTKTVSHGHQADQTPRATQPYQAGSSQIVAQGSAENGYLNFKQWGVRIQLGANNSDGYYVIKQTFSNTAFLSVESLKNNDCAADKTSTGIITRFTAQDVDSSNQQLETDIYSGYDVQIGDYYYVYISPQSTCSDDASLQTKADNAIKAFVISARQIEAIPAN